MDKQTPLQPQNSPGQNLKLRFLSAVVMAALALALTFAGGVYFTLLVALVAVGMLFEWNAICGAPRQRVMFALQSLLILVALAAVAASFGREALMMIAISVPLTLLVGFMLADRKISLSLLFAPLGLVYVALPALAIVWIRLLPAVGFEVTVWVFAIVWATDIGGYAAGRSIGGPKLARAISPNKTWAGLAGGMILAALASWGLDALFAFRLAPLHFAPLPLAIAAMVMAIWGQLGDLAESALKRYFGKKDSGAIIPGHGGILDRVDGFAFVAPVAAFYLWRMGGALLAGG